MAFTPPAPSAVNFVTVGYYEPGKVRHAFQFPLATYAAPVGSAANFVLSSYVYPNGLVANVTVPANANVEAVGAFTVDFVVEGSATFINVETVGNGAFTIDFDIEGHGAQGVKGTGAFGIDFDVAGAVAHGVAGSGAFDLGFSVVGSGTVERYELVGEVRKDGITVNRLVRAYRRDTGALVGEIATTAGKFRLHTGFVAREHYIVPIEEGNDATDWSPPCANRVMSVLAQDAA